MPTKVPTKVGLATIYDAAGRPPVVTPDQLAAGEERMLTDYELRSFVDELYQPLVKPPRNAKPPATKSKEKSTGRPTGRPK